MQSARSLNAIEFLNKQAAEIQQSIVIDKSCYNDSVKRGLRNADGSGVMAGVTRIGNVNGYFMKDGKKMPMPGQLIYRGINVEELVDGFMSEGRLGFEETAYLLLFGALPNRPSLESFTRILDEYRTLPERFFEDMILCAPSNDIMNKLARSVLALYSYDPDPETDLNNIEKELDQVLHLVARTPVIVANAFAVKKHYYDNESLFIHRPKDGLSTAENFLYSVRHDNNFTSDEAQLLDLCLVLHAEHGGGNNSAFACRVLSSSGTDIYSSISAAVGSLKGPKHGGANKKVMEMFSYIEKDVKNWKDETELLSYLRKILRKEAAGGDGLIYGMGHAVYTLSDPRAVTLKAMAKVLAEKKGMLDEFELFETVERLAPTAFAEERNEEKVMCANVDMYSGLVYKMLGIPEELYTPLFAIARMVGWCAHRIEEVFNSNKIIRPAYKAVAPKGEFVPLDRR
ncbi:citrate synthase [Sporobacter termitidis DSM 10068]|uniref:Citrate synthase n=1 Tax=Sporobacter termitidis DSM 10068 TaxID=1123282 RepID=A0A1M5TLV5_9FIRM|nr:citrate synthase [Sporobacter termitidis]SHH51737.1 citrate synthase [Sporobacter termitidis DSM 10068]